MKQVIIIFITLFSIDLYSQSVGIGTSSPNASAILDIISTDKGLLIPRMDSIARIQIAAPSQSLMVYQTNANKGFYYHNGTVWLKIGGDGNEWTKNGSNEIYTTKAIGIGIQDANDFAIMDITSTEKGILIPRMTQAQRDAILNPDGGLLIYQTNLNKGLYHFDGSDDTWKKVGDGPFSWTDGTGTVYTNNRVGIGNNNPSNAAVLDLTSTNKGFLLPRMTTAQRNAISVPVQGLKIYNTDDRCEDIYDGSKWAKNCDMKQNGDATLPANNWRSRSDFPGGERYYSSCFSIGTKIYLGIGQRTVNDTTLRKDFWEYDTETDVWTRKADFAGGFRTEAVGFSIGSKGYIGTGWDGANLKNDFWEYDPNTNIWTQKLNFGGLPRENAVGFSIGSKGYIGTGETNSGSANDFWEYDPNANTWTQKANFGGITRYAAVGFSIGSKGYVGTGYPQLKDFWEFTPAGSGLGTWSQKADFGGEGRAFAVGFSIGTKGYIGTGNNDPKNEFWEYDQVSNLWSKKANVGGKDKSAACGCAVGNKGYIGAGYEDTGLPLLDELWTYNTIPEQGKEYSENIPKDAIVYKTHDWLSEGNKLSTTLLNVNAEINGTLLVTDSTIIDGIKIKDNSLTASFLTLQNNGGAVSIGSPTSTTSDLTINGNESMSNIATLGILNLGKVGFNRLKFDNNKIQSIYGTTPLPLYLQLQPYGGEIGIGLNNSTPDALLHLKGQQNNDFRHIMLEDDNSSAYSLVTCSDNFVVINSSSTGDFIFRNGSTSTDVLSVTPSGNLSISGSTATKASGSSWANPSDIRLKQNIHNYAAGLSDILKIRPVTFNYVSNPKENVVGVIAQELKPIAPYMVSESQNIAPDGSPYLQVDNSAMTYMLINAVKEQQQMIEELKMTLIQARSSIEDIKTKSESEISSLKSEIESIKELLFNQKISNK